MSELPGSGCLLVAGRGSPEFAANPLCQNAQPPFRSLLVGDEAERSGPTGGTPGLACAQGLARGPGEMVSSPAPLLLPRWSADEARVCATPPHGPPQAFPQGTCLSPRVLGFAASHWLPPGGHCPTIFIAERVDPRHRCAREGLESE